MTSEKNLGGRPRQGITKKVSLTLTEEEWVQLDAFPSTIAAFIKEKLQPVPPATPICSEPTAGIGNLNLNPQKIPRELSKASVEERFKITVDFLDKGHPYTDEMIAGAKHHLIQNLFPKDAESVTIETKTQYVCPFTNKRFGSIDKLIEAAVPWLLKGELADVEREEKMKHVREREAAPKYWDQV